MNKKRIVTAIVLGCLSVSIASIAGVSLAGYAISNVAVNQNVAAGEAKRTELFLKCDWNGDTWDKENATFLAWLWNGNGENDRAFFQGTKFGDNYVFRVPIGAYEKCLFVRAETIDPSGYIWGTGSWLWNQTADLLLSDGNYCQITGWGTPNCPCSWGFYGH